MVRSWSRCDFFRLRASSRSERGAVTLVRDRAVKRVAVARPAVDRANGALYLARRHLLSMTRPRRARDSFLHQRAAEIVGAAAQTGFHALAAPFSPGRL